MVEQTKKTNDKELIERRIRAINVAVGLKGYMTQREIHEMDNLLQLREMYE